MKKPSDDNPVLIYDGECKLCRKAVRFLEMKPKETGFEFVPSSADQAIKTLLAYDISPETTRRTLILLDKGRIFTKSAAVIKSLMIKGGLWKITALLFLIPAPLRDAVYDWVASRRNRLL